MSVTSTYKHIPTDERTKTMSHKKHHKQAGFESSSQIPENAGASETQEENAEENTKNSAQITGSQDTVLEKKDKNTEELEKWKDLALRAQAEIENLRKRTQIDIEKANRYANAAFARDLLPVADYLANAIDCAQKEIEKTDREHSECDSFLINLLKGVEMTQKQLQTVFEHHQIQKMETIGAVFNPNLHKVIQETENADKEPGTIVQELQSGYTIGGDRVLREAMVVVTKV